jgi:DNA-directed RNA polymerase specialized sigma24 family protein
VFTSVCNDIQQFNADKGAFLTWILQLARSAAIAYIVESKNQVKTNINLLPDIKQGSIELVMIPGYHAVFDEHDMMAMILQGYKANEVAKELDISVDAVKLGIRKAMQLKARGRLQQ